MVNSQKPRTQAGFTLIEIIAVLVILGILAAVAVPKFVDLQKEARNKAAQGLIAAAQSALSMEYARQLLTNNGDTNATWSSLQTSANNICNSNVKTDGYENYSISCSGSGNVITITVTTPDSNPVTGNFTNPNS